MDAALLNAGGFTPFSASDFPGKLAAVVFVQGCAWRCGYCHNPGLQVRKGGRLAWSSLMEVLRRRAGLLDAVVFSGGEPTTDPALPAAMAAVRELGFQVGLHTACLYPQRLRAVLPLVDWVGFDIKAPFEHYAAITGAQGSGDKARTCAELILASGVDYECRTTVHPAQLPPDMLRQLAHTLAAMGVQHYILQEFRATGCADTRLIASARPGYPEAALAAELAPLFSRFEVRRPV
ncbi:MAG: anaerobic ribonucleoside-triphosphate reductase activating protein [Duganella sp.]